MHILLRSKDRVMIIYSFLTQHIAICSGLKYVKVLVVDKLAVNRHEITHKIDPQAL